MGVGLREGTEGVRRVTGCELGAGFIGGYIPLGFGLVFTSP